MKTKFILSTVVASLLLSSTALFATSYQDSVASKEAKVLQNRDVKGHKEAKEKVKTASAKEALLAKLTSGKFQQEVNKEETQRLQKIIQNQLQHHKNSLQKAPKEFMRGLNDTILAMKALHSDKIKEAEKLLQSATKEFDVALKANPKLDLIPIADNIEVESFNGDAKLIKHIKNTAIELLQNNDTQVAIDILKPLQDEIVMQTQLVPAFLYPKATKEATQDLKSGKKKEAFRVIMSALSATQMNTLIIPIPLVTAEDMILEASQLEKSNKQEALKLLNSAEDELEKAMLLGYTNKFTQDYKDISHQISAIKSEIQGKNIVVKLYDDLLHSFKNLGVKYIKDVKTSLSQIIP